VKAVVHDVFHFFTHLEKGFGYTLKQLIVAPGTMQREYILGDRARHQKPFSMFFICATIAAVGRYWIYDIISKFYNLDLMREANFFHQYWIFLLVGLIPVIALINWLVFMGSKYNYAEFFVITLYNMSAVLIGALLITLLHLVNPRWQTDFIDLSFALVYNVITFVHLLRTQNKWWVAVRTIVATLLLFYCIQVSEDLLRPFAK
jgi:hypothetical protein